MRAFAVRSFGEPASVHDLPVPAADGAFFLRVRFAGVNPLDINLLGRLTAASSYPFVVGIDFAGVAERVPAGEHGVRAGEPCLRHGADARLVCRVHRGRPGGHDGAGGPYPRRRGRRSGRRAAHSGGHCAQDC